MANQIKIAVSEEFLLKVANFIDTAVKHLSSLTYQLASADSVIKSAQVKEDSNYHKAVVKIAEMIGDSDMEYMIEGYDRATFVKKASANPDYLVATMNTMLNVVDPIGLGKTASVKEIPNSITQDPVYRQAFGTRANGSQLMFE